jgi:hypothetical protein
VLLQLSAQKRKQQMTQEATPPQSTGKIRLKKPSGDNHRSALERAAGLPKVRKSRRTKRPSS